MKNFKLFSLLKKSILYSVLFLIHTNYLNAQIALGDTIPYITLQNSLNEPINLRSLKGKVLLIDFWASWCAPCRKANQKLVKLHNSNSTENLTIVGISLDVSHTKWLKAVAKDKIKYTQLIDAHGFDAKSAIQFGVEALPASYLFDAYGKLISINPTEEEIKKQLNHIKQ